MGFLSVSEVVCTECLKPSALVVLWRAETMFSALFGAGACVRDSCLVLEPGVGPAVPLALGEVGGGCGTRANAGGEVFVFHAS